MPVAPGKPGPPAKPGPPGKPVAPGAPAVPGAPDGPGAPKTPNTYYTITLLPFYKDKDTCGAKKYRASATKDGV